MSRVRSIACGGKPTAGDRRGLFLVISTLRFLFFAWNLWLGAVWTEGVSATS
jgi:hypothetical protein